MKGMKFHQKSNIILKKKDKIQKKMTQNLQERGNSKDTVELVEEKKLLKVVPEEEVLGEIIQKI